MGIVKNPRKRRKRKREADLVRDRILGAIINHANPDVPEMLYTTILLQTVTGRNRKRKNPLKKRRLELQGTQNGNQNPQNQILIMARKRKNPQPDGRRLKENPPKRNRLRKRSKKRVVTTILKIRTLKLLLEKGHIRKK